MSKKEIDSVARKAGNEEISVEIIKSNIYFRLILSDEIFTSLSLLRYNYLLINCSNEPLAVAGNED